MAAPTVTQFVERRNYNELEWNHHYNAYYQRNWLRETKSHLNALCDCNTKKSLQKRCKCHVNWNWHLHHIHDPKRNIPTLTGHTSSDIGSAFITIGGRRKTEAIDVYHVSKDFTHCKKLNPRGQVPCCRFAHTSAYIPPLNAILMFGGFDSERNFNDARLLRLEDLTWYNLSYDTDIDLRAYHSSATRMVYNENGLHVFECYIFGGQFCNGGPYVYHNTLFKFQFHVTGCFDVNEIRYIGSDAPSRRAQHYSFIKDHYFYVYGGCDAGTTFNDLWQFDLNTHTWNEIMYRGPIFAPLTHAIEAVNFRVFPARKPCYFDKQLDRIIVIHHGELSEIQTQYTKYADTVYEFQQRLQRLAHTVEDKKHQRSLYKNRCRIFAFSLQEKQWEIIKTNQKITDFNVPPFIGLTCFVRVGTYLVMMGGGKNSLNYMSKLYMLKIPQHGMMNGVSWSRERLIWIGHYKTDQQCLFYKCPKHIICHIVAFLNTNREITRNDVSYYNPEMEECVNCKKKGSTKICSACKKARYCGADCQTMHWKQHKTQCKKWTEQRKAMRPAPSDPSPEPPLIPNTVLRETPTTTGNDIQIAQNHSVTLMGYTNGTNVETRSTSLRPAETLMGFTSCTKH